MLLQINDILFFDNYFRKSFDDYSIDFYGVCVTIHLTNKIHLRGAILWKM